MDDETKTEKELLSENFPSNSKAVRRRKEKKVEKIVSGSVKRQRKPFGRRLSETFLEDNTKSVGDYVVHDVLIPAAKSMISEMVSGGVEMLLFGQRRGSRTYRDAGRSYVNYSSISSRRESPGRPGMSRTGRARHDFGEIILETRGEAEEVLSHLVDLTIDYGMASVADLYDLVGIDSNFTDNKYGWTNLESASVSRVHGGYLINLPRTQIIE